MHIIESVRAKVEETFRASRDDVFRYLVTLGLRPEAAQEIAQEAFLRLYLALSKGDNIENPRAWAFRVGHNLALNAIEREAPLTAFDDGIAATLRDSGRGPEMGALERERMLKVNMALRELSQQQRKCLFLRAEGLSYRQIAEMLNIGVPTVGEFLRRAITRLRNLTSATK